MSVFHDPAFFIVVSFFIVVAGAVYLGMPQKIGALLDKRADDIRINLEEARAVCREAQALLNDYEMRLKNVAIESQNIIKQARDNGRFAVEEACIRFEERMDRRMYLVEEKMRRTETQLVNEIRMMASDLAVRVSGRLIAEELTDKEANKLLDADIKALDMQLN